MLWCSKLSEIFVADHKTVRVGQTSKVPTNEVIKSSFVLIITFKVPETHPDNYFGISDRCTCSQFYNTFTRIL